MAISRKRGLAIAIPIVFAVSVAGLVVSAQALYQAQVLNTLITQGKVGKIENGAPPEVMFAKAYQLRAKGNLNAALGLYQQLEQVPSRALEIRASYNIGNIYVTNAQINALSHRVKDIGTLAAIARTQYQRALRLDSDFYDAKYNLEYTRFLVTEPDSEQQKYTGGLGHEHEQRKMSWAEFHKIPQGYP
ncbi:MAG: hypothetical protein M3120_09505 [Pseudomonadota bacterium]|nr:hypothetical protein [Pseudomonadota bacterium]